MNSGQYSPAFRMMVGQVNQIESISENLANSSVPGYKRLQASHKPFETLFNDAKSRVMSAEDGKRYDPLEIDFTQGPLKPTERTLDFAINGKGFFVVTKDNREFYTRKGDFSVDPEGNLKTADGMAVQASGGGGVTVPASAHLRNLTVDHAGTIMDGTTPIATLRIVSFPNEQNLQRAGSTLYSAPRNMAPKEADPDTKVVNGMLEASNTTIFAELAQTITSMRNFEACRRMLSAQDENEGRMITQLGQ